MIFSPVDQSLHGEHLQVRVLHDASYKVMHHTSCMHGGAVIREGLPPFDICNIVLISSFSVI